MLQRHSLWAFVTVIGSIVVLAFVALSAGASDSQVFGNAITGLVALAGTFRPRQTGPVGEV